MAEIYVKSGGGTKNAGDYRGIWTTAGNWAVGDRVVAVNLISYRVHECTTAGGGDAAEPTWTTTTDGTTTMGAGAVFTTRIPTTLWADATIDATRAMAGDAAGDRINFSQAHSETTAGAISVPMVGTQSLPILAVAGNDAAAPPTAEATAIITTTGAGNITFAGTYFKLKNITFNCGSGANTATLILNNSAGGDAAYENDAFKLPNTSATSAIRPFANTACRTVWKTCDVSFGHASQGIAPLSHGEFVWDGGSILSGGTSPTTLFIGTVSSAFFKYRLNGLNLSNGAAAMNLFGALTGAAAGDYRIQNSILPASWTGNLVTGTNGASARFEMINCDASGADTNYRVRVQDGNMGNIVSDDAIYRAPGLGAQSWMYNGATQVVGISHKYSTSSAALFQGPGLRGLPLAGLNTVINPATSHVITCFFTTPGQADFTPLSDKDIGLIVEYQGNSASPQSKFAQDLLSNVYGTEADQDADTAGDWDDALGAWVASTVYAVGAVVRPITRNGKTYYCSVAGTSHTAEPTWLTTEGGETAEGGGTVRWRCMHRQKLVLTLDAAAGKIFERGWLTLTPVMHLASSAAWVDPQASVTSS